MRRSNRYLLITVAALQFLGSAQGRADDFALSPSDVAGESAFLQSSQIGLPLPRGYVLKAQPFAAPYGPLSFVVPTQWYALPAPAMILASDLSLDLRILKLFFEKAYGGYEAAAARGWNWDEWFANWESTLAASPGAELTLAQARAPFAVFKNFQYDNHTQLGPSEGLTQFSQSATLDKTPAEPCTALVNDQGASFPLNPKDAGQQPHTAYLDGALKQSISYVSFPSDREDVQLIVCGSDKIALHPVYSPMDLTGIEGRAIHVLALTTGQTEADLQKKAQATSLAEVAQASQVIAYRSISPAIGYLRLPPIRDSQGAAIQALNLPPTAGTEKLLILDFRINTGGWDSPTVAALKPKLAKWPIAQNAITSSSDDHLTLKNSCVTQALRWGTDQLALSSSTTRLDAATQAQVLSDLQQAMQPVAADCPVTFTTHPSPWNFTQHKFNPDPTQGPILMVLVDSLCASDCEGALYHLAQSKQTLIVGTSTGGVFQFFGPRNGMLPRTKLQIQIAQGMSDFYGDGRSADGYGLDVDLLLTNETSFTADGITELAQSVLQKAQGPLHE